MKPANIFKGHFKSVWGHSVTIITLQNIQLDNGQKHPAVREQKVLKTIEIIKAKRKFREEGARNTSVYHIHHS